MENFAYLIGSPESREAAVVDPGWDVAKILSEADSLGLKVTRVFLTHTHFDHANGLKELVQKTGAKVYVHPAEAKALKIPKEQIVETEDGIPVDFGGLEIKFLYTPGHTSDSQSVWVDGNIFSGDMLFVGSCGRTDLPTSNPSEMLKSFKIMAALPEETVVWPGHDYGRTPTSTIGVEKKHNPYMKVRDREFFTESEAREFDE